MGLPPPAADRPDGPVAFTVEVVPPRPSVLPFWKRHARPVGFVVAFGVTLLLHAAALGAVFLAAFFSGGDEFTPPPIDDIIILGSVGEGKAAKKIGPGDGAAEAPPHVGPP